MPSLIVHAYADTGLTQTIHGKKVPVLTPMTSFGQYITHDSTTEGNVFGWDAGLEPFNGTAFQKVGVDTYRIQHPERRRGHVVTHVEPLPTKRPTCSGTVNMDILSLLKAIAPLIVVDPVSANEINGLIDSLKIQCVDLHELLTKIDGAQVGRVAVVDPLPHHAGRGDRRVQLQVVSRPGVKAVGVILAAIRP